MSLVLPDLPDLLDRAGREAEMLVAELQDAVAERVRRDGRLDRAALDAEQHAAHGLAWAAAYAETLRQTAAWAERLDAEEQFGEAEALPAQLLAHEYLSQLAGGLPMNQGEMFRPADLDVSADRLEPVDRAACAPGASQAVKHRIVELLDQARGRPSLEASGLDETLEAVRDQFHAFAAEKIAPFAHGWHLRDELIPLELIEELGALGVFGLTAPEDWGGSGLGKVAMCVVSEALSRGWIGTGLAGHPLGDRRRADPGPRHGRTRRRASCPASPPARSSRPRCSPSRRPGSDLASLRTRAVRDGDIWRVTGAKTWITHAARADLMTLLVRTDPASKDHRGLSMFLAEKPRGTAGRALPRARHERRRDRGDRLSRHEGIRDRLRRLRGPARQPAGRPGGPGLRAADGDLRERPHPDRRPRHRRGAERAGPGARLRAGAPPVRRADRAASRGWPTSWP